MIVRHRIKFGSMMVGYECSFPARMDKQLMEVAIALHAAPASATRNAPGIRYGFSHFEQSRNTPVSQVVEMQIFSAEGLAGTSKKRRY